MVVIGTFLGKGWTTKKVSLRHSQLTLNLVGVVVWKLKLAKENRHRDWGKP